MNTKINKGDMSNADIEKYRQRHDKKNQNKPKQPKDWTGLNDPRPPKTRPHYGKYIKKEDKIPGGLADDKTPSDFDAAKLAAGIKVELEHTDDEDVAREIAMDHLTEDANYYKKLKTIEKEELRVDKEVDGKQELDYGKEELDKEELDKENDMDEAQNSAQIAQQEYDKKQKEENEKRKSKKEKQDEEKQDEEKLLHQSGRVFKDDDREAAQNSSQINQQEYDSAMNRWKKLKKAMADDAFMDIAEASAPEEVQEQEAPPEGDLQSDGQDQQTGEDMSDEELHQMLSGIDSGDEEAESDEGPVSEDAHEMDDSQEDGVEEEAESDDEDMETEDQSQDEGADEETLEDLMQQLGYSQQEIAHVVNGHHFPDVDEVKQQKAMSEQVKREGELSLRQMEAEIKQMEAALKNGHAEKMNQYDADHKKSLLDLERSHAERMKDLEYATAMRDHEVSDESDHKQRMRDVEYNKAAKDIPGDRFDDTEHQKRMMDLEYEKAKREMELDLEIKKQQAELKMKQMMIDADVRKKEKAQAVKEKASEPKEKTK